MGNYVPDMIDFSSGEELSFNFFLGKLNNKTYDIVLRGDSLVSYATAEPSLMTEAGTFLVKLKMPNELEPGLHTLQVCSVEHIDEENKGGFVLESYLCQHIKVRSLYPGKYLVWDSFSVRKTDLTENNITFDFSVSNWGEVNIQSAYAQIEIFDGDILLKTKNTLTYPIASTKSLNFKQEIEIEGMVAGDYWSKAKVYWDEGEDNRAINFSIGSADIRLINVSNELFADEINPIQFTIKNGFKGIVDDVHLRLEVAGIAILDSHTFTIAPLETEEITLYWDSKNLTVGAYPAELKIYKAGEEVYQERFDLNLIEKPSDPNSWLIGVLICGFALIFVLSLLLTKYLIRRKKKTNLNLEV